MIPSNQFWFGSGGTPFVYDPDAQLYFDELTGIISNGFKMAINDFVIQLKADGDWAELDRLWIHATENQQNARISLVNPTSTAITEVNTPTWVASKGYAGNASNMYLNTNYTPLSDGVKYTLNSASYFCYFNQVNDATGSFYSMGGYSGTSQSDLTYSTTFIGASVNAGSSAGAAPFGNKGLFHMKRTASNIVTGYTNGVLKINVATVSIGAPNTSMYLLCRSQAGVAALHSANRISVTGYGSGVVGSTTFYNSVEALAITLGFNI